MNKNSIKSYKQLLKINQHLAYYEYTLSLLFWDDRVCMNPKSAKYRGKQISILTEYIHKTRTSKKYSKLIESIDLDDFEKFSPEWVNFKWWKFEYERNKKIPPKLLAKLYELIPVSIQAWEKAKEQKKYKIFSPYLSKIIELNKEMIQKWGYKEEPYEALTIGYEIDITPSQINSIFEPLHKTLKQLISRGKYILQSPVDLKKIPFDQQKLEHFCKYLVKKISGLDIRLDTTSHPFATTILPYDVRITTRYNNLEGAIFGTLHELGHALYDYYLPQEEYFGQPISSSISLSIHESQSRFFENVIGRSLAFWELFYQDLKQYVPDLQNIPLEKFVLSANKISMQPIRIEADEFTYNLHIILRFNLERKIFNEGVKVEELPELWNTMFEEYFGYRPANDSVGILQDIHWAESLFGYFPTYTLGNIISAQILNTIQKHINLYEEVKKGNFQIIIQFLKENLYSLGKKYTTSEVVKKITNEEINSNHLISYLNSKISFIEQNLSMI
ncbi:MAG: carboxypeptidase M32 [bacterium]